VVLQQGGLTLPDRDYYLNEGAPCTTIRERFAAYVTQLLDLAGVPGGADASAKAYLLPWPLRSTACGLRVR
jgi:predicted metalloendopeptidase